MLKFFKKSASKYAYGMLLLILVYANGTAIMIVSDLKKNYFFALFQIL